MGLDLLDRLLISAFAGVVISAAAVRPLENPLKGAQSISPPQVARRLRDALDRQRVVGAAGG